MTRVSPPPIYEPVVDEEGVATIPWTLFFNAVFTGDTGTTWTPTFTSLTTVGTPTITGKYYKIGQNLCYFNIRIVPATSTSCAAGTTFVDNFPFTVLADGACLAVSGLLGSSAGQVEQGTNRIYPPAWTAVTVPLTIVGFAEVR